MERFFGIMPSNEIEREEKHCDKYGEFVIIQAGPRGWTAIFADGSTIYKDEDNDTNINFATAYEAVEDIKGSLTPVEGDFNCLDCEETEES